MDNQQSPTPKVDVLRLKGVNGIITVPDTANNLSHTKPEPCIIEFPIQKESDVAGGGQPMERDFLIDQIGVSIIETIDLLKSLTASKESLNNLLMLYQNQALVADTNQATEVDKVIEQLKRTLQVMDKAEKFVGNKEVAIQLGKETLLYILAQKGCEGIRFYFCRSPYKSPSVAAVGVREFRGKNGKTRKVRHPQDKSRMITVGQDIGINSEHLSILHPEAKMNTVVFNGEVGPPFTISDIFSENAKRKAIGVEDEFIDSLQERYNKYKKPKKSSNS